MLLEQNPNSSTQCEYCPGLAPNLATLQLIPAGLVSPASPSSTLHWVLPPCSFACALAHASDFCLSPRVFQAHLIIMSILESSTQILHEESLVTSGENLTPCLSGSLGLSYNTYCSPNSCSSPLCLFSPPPFLHLQSYKLGRGMVPSSSS